jgi:signal transduction histidine kinase
VSSDQTPPAGSFTPSADWLEAADFHHTVARLLTTVVHQVNNALQTIGGHAELLRSEPGASAVVVRRAETIGAVTARIAALLGDVQRLARPRWEPAVVDLRAVARTALALRHYGLGRAKIEAHVVGEGQALVSAEPHALLQVSLTLLVNAEEALSGAAGGSILMAVDRIGDQVVLRVDDSGPGMGAPAPEAAGIRSGRLGIGLDVARGIIGRLGGQLSINRTPDGSARVTVTLPAAAGTEASAQTAE